MTTIETQPGHRHLAEVCATHGLFREQLNGHCKTQKIADARHDLWFRLVIIEGFSLPKAGRIRGTRYDHTSVLHGVRKIAAQTLDTHPRSMAGCTDGEGGMTLDQIAKELGYTQTMLSGRRGGIQTGKHDIKARRRREFIPAAVGSGHDPEAIADYLGTVPVAVIHRARMHCMDTFGGPYDRSVEEMRDAMGERV
jgi:hypothetical protein